MTVLITLTTAGADTGPFDLYSNTDGYVTPFETNVVKSSLVTGHSSSLVPDGSIIVRLVSTGACTNYIDIPIEFASYPFILTTGPDCLSSCTATKDKIFM